MKKSKMLLLLLCSILCLTAVPCARALTPNPLTAALFFEAGGRTDSEFGRAAYRGMEKAAAEWGVKVAYIEHTRQIELERALNQAVLSDAGMIIGVGFAFSERFRDLAAKHPEKKFVCVDYSPMYDDRGAMTPLPANLAGITFREEEGSYLVGAIAALKSKTGKIGFVGGMQNPVIRKFEAGYTAGAKSVRPDIQVFSMYAGISGHAFNDPAKGYRMAMLMYNDGADIIYHASGGTGEGVFRAAKKVNRRVIGVDADESGKAPGLVLTSMTKNVDVAVYETVRSWAEGKFSGGVKSFGLKEKGVGFVYNDNQAKMIGADVYQKVQGLQSKIISGKLVVPTGTGEVRLSRENLQDILSELHWETQAALTRLDEDLKKGARALSGKDLKGDDARKVLQKLYADHPYIIDCETVSDKGIMLAVEPAAHRSSEGADISQQAHMVRLYKTHRPVLSHSFASVEGPRAVVIHHPVFSADGRFAGSLSALFAPEYLMSRIVGPVASSLPIGIMIMQTDGLMLYDVKTTQIGLNLFNDPLYKPFPDIARVARNMAASPEGKGAYRFYRKPGESAVSKLIYWRTLGLHQTVWRLGINCATDRLEKK